MRGSRFFAWSTSVCNGLGLWFFLAGYILFLRIGFFLLTQENGFFTQLLENPDCKLFVLRAFQLDMRLASVCAAPTLLISLLCGFCIKTATFTHRFHPLWGIFCIAFLTLLSIVQSLFFFAYHTLFDQRVFEIFYDDLGAIAQTAWTAYPLVKYGLLWIGVSAAGIACYRWLQACRYTLRPSVRLIVIVICIPLFIIAIRGTIGRRPLQRKDLSITSSEQLNNLLPNPAFALYYAIKEYWLLQTASGVDFFVPEGSTIDSLLKNYFGPQASLKHPETFLTKTTTGAHKLPTKPKDIFLVIMESQDVWPLWPEYKELNLAPFLKQQTQVGCFVQAFVSAGSGTMPALNTIISGIPEVGIHTNYQPCSKAPYLTACALQMKQLGYRTRFFYGGYLSWQRIGEFAKNQGFDEVYGGSHMGPWCGNEWGVLDEQLFDFVTGTLQEGVPSFNVLMTTSNHPPYNVKLKEKGCPHLREDFLADYTGSIEPRILGHFWYADRCLERFTQAVHERGVPYLFAITADHWSRYAPEQPTPLYMRKCVPFILYGSDNKALKLLNNPALAGSHLDILPSLIELLATKGHPYYSLGTALWPIKSQSFGIGNKAIVTAEGLWDWEQGPQSFTGFPWKTHSELPENWEFMERYYDAIHAAGWYLGKGTAP